jgi:hypothetical protein
MVGHLQCMMHACLMKQSAMHDACLPHEAICTATKKMCAGSCMCVRSSGCFLCRRVLQLEGQLTSLQEEAEERQIEMQATIDSLRQDKKNLEAQIAGVNLHAVEAGDPLVLQVQRSLRAEKTATFSALSVNSVLHSPVQCELAVFMNLISFQYQIS